MRFLIIGLGIYGSNLARDLTDMGHEVIGADNRKANVDAIKDYISTVYLIDATDESALSLLPLNNVDIVVVAIGENFGASIKVVAMLKKLKVKHIYARGIDTLHESILQGFEIDRILTPEQRAARDLTYEMSVGARVVSMRVDDEHFILKFEMPATFVGLNYSDIHFEGDYNLKVVAVTRPFDQSNVLGIKRKVQEAIDYTASGTIVEAGDTLTCYGTRKALRKFTAAIK